jgi:hypothetical protein
MGDVHETEVQGWKLAHKQIVLRRKIGDTERKEIEITNASLLTFI